jgi:mono/diheme cytochrome c family protein
VIAPAPRRRLAGAVALAAVLLSVCAYAETIAERGRYLTATAGCVSCHTADREDAAPFAGGRALVTSFGTFYSPNVTPDHATGIGAWTDAQFLAALRDGVRPTGDAYFPAFPYTSYSGMTAEDALAIKTYLFTLPAVRAPNREHDLPWYLNMRLAARAWKWMFFRPEPFTADPAHDAAWNRGAYLVRHLGHCGECHTPRNRLGALMRDRGLTGNPTAPEDRRAPNITPDEEEGIGDWSLSDLETFLETGMLPDGDFAGSGMGEVIDDNTSRLTPNDRRAVAMYLRSLAPMKGQAR